ncbi:hypothetical protein GF377_00650, partial [candidate division GN15 bacterium]|nr:hypothetical protein [candidate division GN15 bacterium]
MVEPRWYLPGHSLVLSCQPIIAGRNTSFTDSSSYRSLQMPDRISRRLLVGMAIILFLLAGTRLSAFDLDSLLVKSVGGSAAVERIERLDSYYATGTITLNGMPGKFTAALMMPDKLRISIELGNVSLEQGYDGTTAWSRDFNGKVSEISGYEKQEVLNQVYLQTYAFLDADGEMGGREYLGMEARDGETYHKVALYPFNADTLYAYFDTATAHNEIIAGMMDNLETVSLQSDFREVEGVTVAFCSESMAIGAPLSTVSVTESLTLDTALEHSMFSPPGLEVTDFHFPPDQDSVVVPFVYTRGHIYVPAVINGKKRVRLILDSGASANVFNKPEVADLSLPVTGTMPAKGVGGYEEVD